MNAIVGGSLGVTVGVGLAGALLVGWAALAVAGGAAALARRDVA
jgi:hypothetical protein